MISVRQAEKIIFQNSKPLPVVSCPLAQALNAVLREDIKADRDQPPFDKAILDGIAIRFSKRRQGVREFPIAGVQAAGQKALKISKENHCVEIMTGAVVPQRLNCVIPIEKIQIHDGVAIVQNDAPLLQGHGIQRQGLDRRKGEILLKAGMQLGPAHMGVAASVGRTHLRVTQKPTIALIATGDELVDVEQKVKPFQIRTSNSYALQAIVQKTIPAVTQLFHIKDDPKKLERSLKRFLRTFDILVLSGGVSMGKFDFVPQVLQKLGVEVLFHKVQQKPGKPFWFGRSQEGKPVFALPGNPVSTQICAYRYLVPYLQRVAGLAEVREERVLLSRDFHSPTELAYFLPVRVACRHDGQWWAKPVSISGSGDYTALAQADGFVELPAGQKIFKRGSVVRLFR